MDAALLGRAELRADGFRSRVKGLGLGPHTENAHALEHIALRDAHHDLRRWIQRH